MTAINYKLLDIISPNWAAKFRKGLTPKDYDILIGEPKFCIVGCFYNYNDSYVNDLEHPCFTCSDFADTDGVGGVLENRLDRDKRFTDNIPFTLEGDNIHFKKNDPLKQLDKQGIQELNGVIQEFYDHVRQEHPELLIEKLERAAGVKK